MKIVRLPLRDKTYPIFIGSNLLSGLGKLARNQGIGEKTALIVSQKAIADLYAGTVMDSLKKEGIEPRLFLTPPAKSSEAAKSADVFWKLIRELASMSGKNKSVALFALGGGVIGDLTGFAASVYRRGISYVQIPTTLTAQVDSSIGGKTAIDLPEGKNLLGSVYQPSMVLCDLETLRSLPDRQFSEGFAEVIKYGVIRDPLLFGFLEKMGKERVCRGRENLEKVITACAKIKAKVVSQDELDKKDIRIVLNFGHTAGHAIEAASSFSQAYTHGEAVAIGMLVACDISKKLGVLKDAELPTRLEGLLVKYGLPVFYKALSMDSILEAMGHDKKALKGKNRFVLPVAFGKTQVVRDIPVPVITEALLNRKR